MKIKMLKITVFTYTATATLFAIWIMFIASHEQQELFRLVMKAAQ